MTIAVEPQKNAPVERQLGEGNNPHPSKEKAIDMPTVPQTSDTHTKPAWATRRQIGDEDSPDVVQDTTDFTDGDFNVTIDRFSRHGVVGDFDTVIDFTNRYSSVAEREEFAITIAQVPDLIAVLQRVLTEVER